MIILSMLMTKCICVLWNLPKINKDCKTCNLVPGQSNFKVSVQSGHHESTITANFMLSII